MPDLFFVFSKRWKLIIGLTLTATIIALVICLLLPKKYLSTATALPANSAVADKARLFNPNIESLYSDFGSPDELERILGASDMDTLYIEAAKEFNLEKHYGISGNSEGVFKAAQQ